MSATPKLSEEKGCDYLLEYLKIGAKNNPAEVLKLQKFLLEFEQLETPVTGVFDQATFEAVSAFQERYKEDILVPWEHPAPTGYVYITTKKKINEIYCEREFPLSAEQKDEIQAYKQFVKNTEDQNATEPQKISKEVGMKNTDKRPIAAISKSSLSAQQTTATATALTAGAGFSDAVRPSIVKSIGTALINAIKSLLSPVFNFRP